jgi:hypothetical protein
VTLAIPALVFFALILASAKRTESKLSSKDLQDSIQSLSTAGWEWTDLNGWVSADRLRLAPPLGHLYDYVLASNFLVPMQIPAGLKADA